MKNIIFKWVGVVGTIAFAVLWLNTCNNLKNDIKLLTADVSMLQADYDSCKNAKIYVDTIVDTVDRILGYVEIPIEREVIRYDTIWMYDTSYVLPITAYFDTLKTDDFELFWRAEAIRLSSIEFPYYRLFDQTITESHVIEKVRYRDVYKDRSHLYFTFGLNTKFDKGLSGFSGGFDYINRKGWGVGAGYLRVEKLNLMTANVKLRIL